MSDSFLKSKERFSGNILLIIGIIFIAFNLRPAITAVGPLISDIRSDTGISNGLAGLLTSLPLITFGLISPFVPKISRKLGNELSMLLGLLTLGAGIIIRSTGMLFSLFAGTMFIGFGIAICNVLLPVIVKMKFPQKVGLLTGVYTLSMGLGAGLAPGLSIPLAEGFSLGWKMTLGLGTILIFSAIVIWLPLIKMRKRVKKSLLLNKPSSSIWSSMIAWHVTFFMGLQSLIYFSITTWLPEILTLHGFSNTSSGWMITLLQICSLPVSFVVPILADRFSSQKGLAAGLGILCLFGLIGYLLSTNLIVLTICTIMIGMALGGILSLSLTIIGLRTENAKEAADLSGMVQCVGYLIAALGPLLVGYLFDMFHTWTFPLLLLTIIAIFMTISGIGAGRNQYVFPNKQEKKPNPFLMT